MKKYYYTAIVCCISAWMTGCGGKTTMQTEIEVDDAEYSAPCDNEETLKVIKPAEDDPVIGIFVCDETSDRYIFYDDGTGNFRTGGEETEFVWRHSDGLVIVTFLTFGKEYLHYDKEKRILQEESEAYGRILKFKKVA